MLYVLYPHGLRRIEKELIDTYKIICETNYVKFDTHLHMEPCEIRNLLRNGNNILGIKRDECLWALDNGNTEIVGCYESDPEVIEKALWDFYIKQITDERFYEWCLCNVLLSRKAESVSYGDTVSISNFVPKN